MMHMMSSSLNTNTTKNLHEYEHKDKKRRRCKMYDDLHEYEHKDDDLHEYEHKDKKRRRQMYDDLHEYEHKDDDLHEYEHKDKKRRRRKMYDDNYDSGKELCEMYDANYDYYDDKVNEALDSFETTMTTYMSTNEKWGFYGDNEEETSNLISLFKEITRVKVAITSAFAHVDVVEDSEMSEALKSGMEGMNKWLYIAAVNTDAGCFISEGLLNLVQVINEKEEGEGNCCAICLEGMKSGDVIGWIEHCDHSFHFVCLNEWMKRVHTCPVCRYEMDDGEQLLLNGDCNE